MIIGVMKQQSRNKVEQFRDLVKDDLAGHYPQEARPTYSETRVDKIFTQFMEEAK